MEQEKDAPVAEQISEKITLAGVEYIFSDDEDDFDDLCDNKHQRISENEETRENEEQKEGDEGLGETE